MCPARICKGVGEGLDFLRQIREGQAPACQGVSAVIGGGNTAIDVARSIVRLGGKALLLYRRRRRDMPAFDPEVEMALEEGVELQELVAPVAVAQERGQILLTLQEMMIAGEEDSRGRVVPDPGKTRESPGRPDFQGHRRRGCSKPGISRRRGPGHADAHVIPFWTAGGPGAVMVFGGDLTNETKSVVHAVASGKQAAMALDILFQEGDRGRCPETGGLPGRRWSVPFHGDLSGRGAPAQKSACGPL